MKSLVAAFAVLLSLVAACSRLTRAEAKPQRLVFTQPIVVEAAAQGIRCSSRPCVLRYRYSYDVNVDSVKKAIAWLDDAARAKPDAIVFEINTGGGSTVAGFELAKAIESSSTPITCVVDGEAASMGFYILQSCPVRAMTRRSSLMAHEVSFTIHGRGQPNFWRSIADWIKAHNDAFAEHCAHRLKITLAEYHARTDGGKMWWLNWEEALKVGAVDVVVDSVVEVEKALKKQ